MSNAEQSPMFKLGFENRKAILGAEHVERSWAAADEFNRPMQQLVTEYCWGAIWGRDDLPRKTRSLLNIAMLTAMNRQHELKVHIQGALRNGAAVEEIRGVLMQAAIYCGLPAALDAFRVATEAVKSHSAALGKNSQGGADQGRVTVILELAVLQVRPGMSRDFEAAFSEAERIISSMAGYQGHELHRCLERQGQYVLLVRWDSVEAHEEGFRKSAQYQEWKRLLHHFYDPFPTVLHYERVAGLS